MISKFKWKLSMESIHTINEEFERLNLSGSKITVMPEEIKYLIKWP